MAHSLPNAVSPPAPAFVPWARLDETTLDPPIQPLVAALNRTGWARTVFSCAGHPEEAESVARGRRQAHVDVAVADLARWRQFVQRCRRDLPGAVDALALPGVRLRVAEGSLGPLPPWLRHALADEGHAAPAVPIASTPDLTDGFSARPHPPWPRPDRTPGRPTPRVRSSQATPPPAPPAPARRGEGTGEGRGPACACGRGPAPGPPGVRSSRGPAVPRSKHFASPVRWLLMLWWQVMEHATRVGATTWWYRRLVFEPVPYAVAPEVCRHALDTALDAAVRALE